MLFLDCVRTVLWFQEYRGTQSAKQVLHLEQFDREGRHQEVDSVH